MSVLSFLTATSNNPPEAPGSIPAAIFSKPRDRFRILPGVIRENPHCQKYAAAIRYGQMKLKRKRFAMDYTKYMKSFSGVNSARLALWAALLFVVLVVGVAVVNSGPP
jgi:hypothetical protein